MVHNTNKYPKISVIIPVYIMTDYLLESIRGCLNLDYPNFEILVVIDAKMKVIFSDKRIIILKTGLPRTGPAEKRDLAIAKARGDLIAFLDDDSYPEKDWLKKTVEVMNRMKVSAVCGPGLTPPADNFSQKITGSLLASCFGSGPYFYRFTKGNPRFVDDYPAYNMIVKKDTLLRVGGFSTKFYGGEDTALCLKLINGGEKIYYHPDIVVYHHRRSFPFEYIRQVGNVGLHRGYFVKKYPQTSFRLSYFAPAIFTIGTPIFILLLIILGRVPLLITLILTYYIGLFIYSLQNNSAEISILLPVAIVVNYLAYGSKFIKGLFLKKLER